MSMILGLALGILSSFLLLTYVFDQLSYDRYLPDANRVYRITSDYHGGWGTQQIARCYDNWIRQVKDDYPEVVQLTKFNDPAITAVTVNGNEFKPSNFFEADSTFFQVFPFDFIYGNGAEALRAPNSVVLTESIAHRYFGSNDPVGKRLEILDENSNKLEYHVTGVIKNVPLNSHFHPNFIASWGNSWEKTGMGYYYILLKQKSDANGLQGKLSQFVGKHLPPDQAREFSLHLQALTDIHLNSHLSRELEVNGNATQVYALSIVAFLILIITCINYINLAIARRTASIRELGVRKVLGANASGMFMQNVAESFTYIVISLLIALILFEPSLSALEKYLNLKIAIDVWSSPVLLSVFAIELLLLSLVSGGYPTLVTSRLSSVEILSKGSHSVAHGRHGMHGLFSRKVLLVLQFSLAILLIASVTTVVQQMNYVTDANLGYDSQQLVAIPNIPFAAKEKYDVLKKELMKESGVIGVTTSLMVPSQEIVDKWEVSVGGKWNTGKIPFCDVLPVDRDFVKVMKMKLLAGSTFDKYISTIQPAHRFGSLQNIQKYFKTTDRVYMLNAAAVKELGWKSPQEAVGKQIALAGAQMQLKTGPVIGVVENFHFTSLHHKMEPIVMFVEPLWYNNVLIRVAVSGIDGTLARIKHVWDQVNPGYPFDYEFVSDVFASRYAADNQFKVAMGIFSSIAVIIACIGLFAVSLFTTERRIKEIGIRKVLGAHVSEIVIMLTKDLTKWTIISNAIAWPLAYYAMTKWLEGFAYHIHIQMWTFVLAGLITFFVAAFTVGLQALKAAAANPVESLRYE